MAPARYGAVLVLVFFLSCRESARTVKPETSGITESVYASGRIQSREQYTAYATVTGIIRRLFVAVGDTVQKGAPVLAIDNEAQLLTKRNAALAADFAAVTSNREKLQDARLSIDLAAEKMRNDSLLYLRQATLWEQNIGTRVELEQRQLAFLASRKNYFASRTSYDDLQRQITFNAAQARNNLAISGRLADEYILRSEINGVVYELPRKRGEIVTVQTPLALIGDAGRFFLELQVDERDILEVREGMPVAVTIDSYRGRAFDATVTKVTPMMSERSKTAVVEAEFNGTPPRLLPNTSVEASIILRSKQNALLIPRSCLLNDSTVLLSNGKEARVQIGLKDYQKVEIISGLTPGDELKQPQQ